MQRRSLLSLAAGSLATPFVIAQAKLTKLKFTLDFRITGQTAPFFLAQSKGYYREEGLDVQIDVGQARWPRSPAWPAAPTTWASATSAR